MVLKGEIIDRRDKHSASVSEDASDIDMIVHPPQNVSSTASTSNAIPASIHPCTPSDSTLQTEEARAINKVLGFMPKELEKYDRKKEALKKSLNQFILRDDVLELRAPLETQTLKAISALKREYGAWERSFMVKNDLAVPNEDDIEDEFKIMRSRIRIGEQLLEKWGISFDI